jgi:hypothetical protein
MSRVFDKLLKKDLKIQSAKYLKPYGEATSTRRLPTGFPWILA